ncbi:peroxisomal membrane anchor protein conserved region-domain-containing protein [Usnea florida]
MGDNDGPKPKVIPTWQRQESSKVPEQLANTPPQESVQHQHPESRASLIESASKFLEDESIRNAPIERKKLFLESKGLTAAEIDELLEIQHTPEAAVVEDNGPQQEEVSQSTPPTPQRLPASSIPQEPPPPAAPSNDPPPIITYPEFLLHAQKPSPLITANRLLTSLYIASGTAATIYGTSKYVIEPMIENLTSARHSLFESAGASIDVLNQKLESAVSKVPEPPLKEEDSDTESMSEDGARFFNRSAGTQTSPHRSRSSSSASSEAEEAISSTQYNTSALVEMHRKLSDLVPVHGEPSDPLGDSISGLRAYLDKLPRENSVHVGGKAGTRGKVDAVANLKAEIRSVKGVLLSARNFPSGVVAR